MAARLPQAGAALLDGGATRPVPGSAPAPVPYTVRQAAPPYFPWEYPGPPWRPFFTPKQGASGNLGFSAVV